MLFAGLLETLRRRGYTITVDHELRLQRLLPHLDAQCSGPDALRDLLCPLFAVSKEQQEEFGPIFAEWILGAGVRLPEPAALKAAAVETPPEKEPSWYARAQSYLALALVLIALVWWLAPRMPEPPQKVEPPAVTETKRQVIETKEGPVQQIEYISKTYEPLPNWVRTWERYRTPAKGTTASILLAWLLFEIWRYQKRRLILQRDRADRQQEPHKWALDFAPRHAGLLQDATLAEAARRLRVRERSAQYSIDLPATIRAAVRKAGFLPGFLVRQRTQEPAYLMLIDRHSLRDHQMLLFAEYARVLRQRNVDVKVVHFEGDPRYPVDANWGQLKLQHANARLLVAADGESLRHQATGRLLDWVAAEFAGWEHRALLTPVEPERWGWREKEVALVLPVWPATGAGLLGVSQWWNGERVARATSESIAGRWLPPRRWRDADDEAVRELRADLGEAGFRWLCACAQAPELLWDITQWLGELPDVQAAGARDPWRLFTLEWFRQGFIPRHWSYRLAAEYPAQEARRAMVEMFKAAPDRSDVGQRQRLWVQFERFWPSRVTLQGWWQLRRWVRGVSPETVERDVVVMRSLDTWRRSPIDLIFGEDFSRWLHVSGVSLMGLRTVFRFAAVALATVIVAVGIGTVERTVAAIQPAERQERSVDRLGDLMDVYFDVGSASIRGDARQVLTRFANEVGPLINGNFVGSGTLEGHASDGSPEEARGLGDRRAIAVKETLVALGLPAAKFKTISYGQARPICTEATETCRQRNDRVHLSVGVQEEMNVRTPTSAGDIVEQYRLIPKGTFQMGCSPGDSECFDMEKPAHAVTLTRDFYMAATEVTAENYLKFATHTKRTAPEKSEDSETNQDPMVNVSWDDAKAYCAFVSGRLPTSAEWEYAARGGTAGPRYGPLDEIAWHSDNSNSRIHPVRQKRPNAYGLFDMLGNAYEWTQDWFGDYQNAAAVDPKGPATGEYREVRGGSWIFFTRYSRASFRNNNQPGGSYLYIGFRCVRLAP